MIGLDLLGADVGDVGYVKAQVAAFRTRLDKVPVTVSVARAVVARAWRMIDQARQIVAAQGARSLIGPRMIEAPAEHILWHRDKLAALPAAADPNAIYESADDLRKWAGEAYGILMTATQERALQERIRDEFWRDVGQAIKDLPARLRPGNLFAWLTGLPLWAWALIAVGGAGAIVGVAAWFLRPAVPTVARVAAERYLPGRPI